MIASSQRRGACPSLSAPMPTGDGLLVRLNPIDGSISPSRLAQVARAAGRLGNGLLEVTARGSLQIRGLTETTAPQLAAFVEALGLDVRTGVPIEIAPLAGLDPDEIVDPRPLAAAVRNGIARLGLSARLGPKVSVVVDGGGRSMLDGVKADVRLTAERRDGRIAWRLALAGDAATATCLQTVTEADACSAVVDRLTAIAARGRAARAKDLLEGDPTIARGPVRQSGDLHFGTPIPLTDARFAVRVALPFGSIDAASLEHFANALAALGIVELRPCLERSLLVLSDTPANTRAALAAADDARLIVDAADPRLAIVACAGAPACASAHYATRPLAEAIARDASDLLVPETRLHLSGCRKRCAEPSGPSIAVIGHPDGCAIVAIGTSVPPALREYLARRASISAHDRRAP